MSNLHSTDYQIRLKQGTQANINTTATKNSAVEGEPHYTTDTQTLYVSTGEGSLNEPVTGRSPLASVSGNTTLTLDYEVVEVTAACTITLPTAVGNTNKIFEIVATVDGIVVDANSTETINGELTQTLYNGDAMRIISNGSNWRVL